MEWLVNNVYPVTWQVFKWVFLLNLLAFLPATLPKRLRYWAALGIYCSSYLFGLECWLVSVGVCYVIGGWLLVIIGVAIAGVGVIPIAAGALAVTGHWHHLLTVLGIIVVVVAARLGPAALISPPERRSAFFSATTGTVTDAGFTLAARREKGKGETTYSRPNGTKHAPTAFTPLYFPAPQCVPGANRFRKKL